jgi:hypothetical protein
MWSPVTPKMHFPSVKQFAKPKFEKSHKKPKAAAGVGRDGYGKFALRSKKY